MGRARQRMEYIEKKKSRILTFKKRKEGLMKKLHELTTLCDVGACMIIYEPTQQQSSIWPEQNPGEVRRLIHAYNSGIRDSGIKSYGLSDFFEEKRRKVEEETIKLRRKNLESKFPTSDHDCLSFMDESQLRELGAALSCKAQIVRSRIQFLKQKEMETMNNMMLLDSDSSQFYNLEQEIMDNLCKIYNLDQEIKPDTDTDMIVSQNYYAPPPPCMVYSSMEDLNYYSAMVQNLDYWADDCDDITQYLM